MPAQGLVDHRLADQNAYIAYPVLIFQCALKAVSVRSSRDLEFQCYDTDFPIKVTINQTRFTIQLNVIGISRP